MIRAVKKYFLPITIGFLGIIVLVCVAGLIFVLMPESATKYASRASGVNIPKDAVVIMDYSSSISPQGDNETMVVLQIPPEEIQEFVDSLAASSDWKSLPLSEYLTENEHCLQPNSNLGEIPTVNVAGYYIFRDRATHDVNKPFCKRWDHHFFFGLFNATDGRLYLYNVDT